MANPWEAEIDVTPDLVRELLGAQFPELVLEQLAPYGEGWDNLAYLVNGEWVFRFPKRELARRAMQNETRCLLGLGKDLPLAVPRLEFVGAPQGMYPFPFSGYRELPGQTACRASLNAAQRAACAGLLGSFLARLHAADHALVKEHALPGDEIRRTDLAYRLTDLERRLDSLQPSPDLPDLDCLRDLARDLASTPAHIATPRVVHGDLYARHLLVDHAGRLTGVIDWGDAHLGDPALDLSIQFAFLPLEARADFEAAYGKIDPATSRRARFRALVSGAALVQYGESVGDIPIAAAGRYALQAACQFC